MSFHLFPRLQKNSRAILLWQQIQTDTFNRSENMDSYLKCVRLSFKLWAVVCIPNYANGMVPLGTLKKKESQPWLRSTDSTDFSP